MYPVGDNNDYSPFLFQLDSGTVFGGSDFISISVTDAMHPSMGPGDFIDRYWTMDAGGFSTIAYQFRMTYVDSDVNGTEANLIGNRYDGASWFNYDAVDAINNALFNSSSETNMPFSHDFTGGVMGPLPVGLLNFEAYAMGRSVVLQWATAFEQDNDYYSIERSQDGITYAAVGALPGAFNTANLTNYEYTDGDPLDGVSYYRLVQYDLDGKQAIYGPVAVRFESKPDISFKAYPNPISNGDIMQLNIQMDENVEAITVCLMNQMGQLVCSKAYLLDSGAIQVDMALKRDLKPGVYFVLGSTEERVFRQKLIIEDAGSSSIAGGSTR
jgi:hypothetical protein